jgi:ribosome biogenesis GTPase / thiamine phosphate phosphatase
MMNPLSTYGWTSELDTLWANLALTNVQPARVVADFGTSLKIALPEIITAELSGKLAHYTSREESPKVGDWVAVHVSDNGHAVIEALIPRQSEIARKVAGNQTLKQVIAANVDVAFVLLAVGKDFNLDRLRRFLYQLSVSNIKPVIVLNKADKTKDTETYLTQLKSFELPVVTAIATEGVGIDAVLEFIQPGKTAVLLGSSGVGKSTLTNQLLGRTAQKTQDVRESDESGKHTTVHRELFILPGGGLLVDMPGIRELQLWGTEEDLADNFDDVAAITRQCKYTTCRHGSEDGCAVQRALNDGTLDSSRYAAYVKMKAELQALEKRTGTLLKRNNEKAHRVATFKRNRESRNNLRDEMN